MKCGEIVEDFCKLNLELVKFFFLKVLKSNKIERSVELLCCDKIKLMFDNCLLDEENRRVLFCVRNFKIDYVKGNGDFWSGNI